MSILERDSLRHPGAAISKLPQKRRAGDILESNMPRILITLSDVTDAILREESQRLGISKAAHIEHLILRDKFGAAQARVLMKHRRGPGRIPVVVVPDDVELPPEG